MTARSLTILRPLNALPMGELTLFAALLMVLMRAA